MYGNIGESVRRLQTGITEYNHSTEMEEASVHRMAEHLCKATIETNRMNQKSSTKKKVRYENARVCIFDYRSTPQLKKLQLNYIYRN